jgi:hypothetical protein
LPLSGLSLLTIRKTPIEQIALIQNALNIETPWEFSEVDLDRKNDMDKLKREYDLFGPWVLEIKDEMDIPQQFGDFTETILNGIYSFKVPVNVERRNLKPGMLLYQTVTVLTEDAVIVLQHRLEAIERQEVKYADILFLQCTTDLLFGELIFGTAQQRYIMEFSSIEYGPVETAIDRIREKYCDQVPKANLGEIQEQVVVKSFLYETLLAQEMEKEELKLVAYQPSMQLKRKRAAKTRFWRIVSGETGLQDSLYLTNGKELIVMSRVKDVKAEKKADYGYRYTYIPLNNIRTLLLEPHKTMERLLEFSIVMEEKRLVFRVDDTFPVDVLKSVLRI